MILLDWVVGERFELLELVGLDLLEELDALGDDGGEIGLVLWVVG